MMGAEEGGVPSAARRAVLSEETTEARIIYWTVLPLVYAVQATQKFFFFSFRLSAIILKWDFGWYATI